MGQSARRILIVDDEPTLLKMMATYLGRLGYSVTTAATTEKAWAEVEAQPGAFAVAVLDVTMPGIGFQALSLKILSASPALRVLAASGYPMDLSELAAQAPGRVEFLQKPFTPEMLAAAVRRMLAAEKEGL
jgi:two-component system, cell cycle sensor histidine kinase and response regulator CckA